MVGDDLKNMCNACSDFLWTNNKIVTESLMYSYFEKLASKINLLLKPLF